MKIFFILVVMAFSASAFAQDLSGIWEGKPYSIQMSGTFEDIEGHWGDIKYDLDVSETFQDIEGTIGNGKVDIDVSATFSDVEGELPCGKVDYDYSLTFKDVEGVICGQQFDINLSHEDDVIPTAQDILLTELLSEFPGPVKGALRRFILQRIHFSK